MKRIGYKPVLFTPVVTLMLRGFFALVMLLYSQAIVFSLVYKLRNITLDITGTDLFEFRLNTCAQACALRFRFLQTEAKKEV